MLMEIVYAFSIRLIEGKNLYVNKSTTLIVNGGIDIPQRKSIEIQDQGFEELCSSRKMFYKKKVAK